MLDISVRLGSCCLKSSKLKGLGGRLPEEHLIETDQGAVQIKANTSYEVSRCVIDTIYPITSKSLLVLFII